MVGELLLRIDDSYAQAEVRDQATAALAPRLGFRLEATHLQAALHRTEGWSDSVTYAILADEWAERRAYMPGLTRSRGGPTAASWP